MLTPTTVATMYLLFVATESIDHAGAGSTPPYNAQTPSVVSPSYGGCVTHVNPDGKRVRVNLGSEDGLRQGDLLEVYKWSQYKGRIEIVTLSEDTAVAKVVWTVRPIIPGDSIWARKWWAEEAKQSQHSEAQDGHQVTPNRRRHASRRFRWRWRW